MKKKIFLIVIGILFLFSMSLYSAEKKFSLIMPLLKFVEDGQQQILDQFKKLTGVTIDLKMGEYNTEKLLLTLQADPPDVIEIPTNMYGRFISDGVLIDLSTMIANSKYVKLIQPQYLDVYKLKNGKIYAVPYQNGGGCLGYIRKDWLNKVKLPMPKTYDEFVQVLRAFTFNDPDGNGKADTYGYTTLVDDSFDSYNRLIFQDAFMDIISRNNTWIDGFSQPEVVAAMKRLKALYDEKLIDPQFITAKTTSEARTKFYEGKVGVYEYWAGEWGMNLDEYVKKSNPKGIAVSMPALQGVRYRNRLPLSFGITTKAKDPQMIFDSFIEGFFDKGKRQILWTYGVEDVHWKYNDANLMEFLPSMTDKTKLFKKSKISRELQINDMPIKIPLDERFVNSMKNFTNVIVDKPFPATELLSKNYGDLLNLKKETVLKIVTGEYPSIEAGLDAYKKRAESELKLSAMLAEMNK